MMIKFINKMFGTEMWVDESRVDEYIAAGHALAADTVKKTVEKKIQPTEDVQDIEKEVEDAKPVVKKMTSAKPKTKKTSSKK